MQNTLSQTWHTRILSDVNSFCDLGIEVLSEVSPNNIRVIWQKNGQNIHSHFQLSSNGDLRWITSEGHFTYPDFLASPSMGDLQSFARAQVTLYAQDEISNYIPSKAKLINSESAGIENADNIVLETVKDYLKNSYEYIDVIFIKADAGTGKTTLLKHICLQQSRGFLNGNNNFLFLYVSALGKSLSSLEDVFAGELSRLRARLSPEALQILVRNKLVVPIIDGFDELLGSAGYGNAFGSLKSFLEKLNSQGVVLASARASFYDLEFTPKSKLNIKSNRLYFNTSPVELFPWDEDQIIEYLKLQGASNNDLELYHSLDKTYKSIIAKPFFASKFLEYSSYASTKDDTPSLVEYLVDSLIVREQTKLRDRNDTPLINEDTYLELYSEFADLMWQSERREIDVEEIRTMTEIKLDDLGYEREIIDQLVNRSSTIAGLKSVDKNKVTFEHELYFDYLLSKLIRGKISHGSNVLGSFLDRSILPDDAVNFLSLQMANDDITLKSVLDKTLPDSNTPNRRRNLGKLVATYINHSKIINNISICHVDLIDSNFDDAEFNSCKFKDIQFNNVSIANTKFHNCSFEDVSFFDLSVNSNTFFSNSVGINFDPEHPSIYSMIELDSNRALHMNPEKIAAICSSIGLEISQLSNTFVYSNKHDKIIDLFTKLAKILSRSNQICKDYSDNSYPRIRNLIRDDSWAQLEEILVESRIAEIVFRDTSGPRREFLQFQLAGNQLQKVMARKNSTNLNPADMIDSFWIHLRSI